MFDSLLHAATGLLIAILGFFLTKLQRDRDRLAEANQTQFRALASYCEFNKDRSHNLEVRMTTVETKAHNLSNQLVRGDDELSDIRDNMVRREDLTALGASLGKRVDDAVRFFRDYSSQG